MSQVEPARRRPKLALWRANREKASFWYHVAAYVVHVVLTPWGRRDWRQAEKLPRTGGVLIVCNHISQFDPVTLGDYLIWSGRWPRYLAKIGLFKSKIIGWLLRSTESVPVDRFTSRAADSLVHAKERIAQGKAVLIYPEGTETTDPDIWPMKAKTGAARLALATRAPVIPCAQWGAHRVISPTTSHPKRFFGQRFSAICGDPVNLAEFYDMEPTRKVLEAATERMMDAITALLEELRGERAPAQRWDRHVMRRVPVVREVRGQTL
jgi:1-acyl-sn-glycerol-3-phosphate acyltransferase